MKPEPKLSSSRLPMTRRARNGANGLPGAIPGGSWMPIWATSWVTLMLTTAGPYRFTSVAKSGTVNDGVGAVMASAVAATTTVLPAARWTIVTSKPATRTRRRICRVPFIYISPCLHDIITAEVCPSSSCCRRRWRNAALHLTDAHRVASDRLRVETIKPLPNLAPTACSHRRFIHDRGNLQRLRVPTAICQPMLFITATNICLTRPTRFDESNRYRSGHQCDQFR
ncbi:hypothetical protein Y026_5436 [Burkholderia pseudomallei TSV28]|nr:hypothetical protein Y026_5436 [Burkholderia pseudomallei TSV28]